MGAWVFRRDGERLRRQLERAYATFPALADKRRARAGELSGGQGRMLSVARELMTEPQLLLVDEPTAGLAPNLVEQVYDILLTAKQSSGVAILLVEQNVEQALPLADHLYLLNLGRVKAQGPGQGIRQHARAGTDPGMSSGLTKGWGAFVDWRRVALVAVAAGLPLAAVPLVVGEFVRARAEHRRLLRDPGGELEPAGRLHRPVLARAARLRGGRRLYVSGLLIYHLQDAADRQHPGGRAGGRARRLPARPARAAHAHDLSLDRHLGVRRNLSHRAHRGLRVHARRSRPERAVALRPCAADHLLLHLRRRRGAVRAVDARDPALADRLFHARREGRPDARAVARRRHHAGQAVRLHAVERDGGCRRRALRALRADADAVDRRLQRDGAGSSSSW